MNNLGLPFLRSVGFVRRIQSTTEVAAVAALRRNVFGRNSAAMAVASSSVPSMMEAPVRTASTTTAAVSFYSTTPPPPPTSRSSIRFFHSSSPLPSSEDAADASRTALSDILARENEEEVDNGNDKMPPEVSDLKRSLQDQGWKIVEDGAVTKLVSTNAGAGGGGSRAQISFHCQDTVEEVSEDYYAEEGDPDAGDDNAPEPSVPIRFTCTVSRAGKTLVATCLAEDATFRIQSAALSEEDLETIQSNAGVDGNAYQGPEFVELAEDLQSAFHAYLEDAVGINEDVSSFISMYADYREQQEYINFLGGVKSILG